MKKKFILFMGRSWSGTTSLYWTLQNINFMHGGFWKETSYLYKIDIDQRKDDYKIDEINHRSLDRLEERLYKKLLKYQQHYYDGTDFDKINLTTFSIKKKEENYRFSLGPANKSFIDVLKKFSFDDIEYFFNNTFSIEKYVEQYVKLSEYCGDQYQSVGDFSNRNFLLSKDTLVEVKNKLEKYFDIKVLFIFRDPIRTHFSTYCALTNNKFFEMLYDDFNLEYFKTEYHSSTFSTDPIKNAREIFGEENVHYVIMEDFFKEQENNLEVQKLEHYLNTNISKIFPCCFVPDKGINAPKIVGLEDQWNSDHEKLPPDVYGDLRIRDDFFKIYEEFKKFHGSLPADWGRPIDYGY